MSGILSSKNIAAFYLILMCVAILPIEGWGVSPIKVAAMAIAPLIMLIKAPVISRATVFGLIYLLFIVFNLLLQGLPFRSSTIVYLAMFICMFVMYYNLIYTGAFTIDFFIKLLQCLLYAFSLYVILQQLFVLAGIRYFPPLNLINQHYLSVFKVNSLTWEPSSSARIMAVAFLAFLKTNEIKNGSPLSIKELLGTYKWLSLVFLYAMLAMGSGTAFVGLAVLSLSFVRKQYVLYIVPLFLLFYLVVPMIDYKPLQRAVATVTIIFSDDPNQITKKDNSAAVRVQPIINTFTKLDLTDKKEWLGEGTDASQKYSIRTKNFSKQKMSGINDYGLIGFILGILLIYSCCLSRFFSLEALLFFLLVGLAVNNISYIWGVYMLFVPVEYFRKLYADEDYKPEIDCHLDGNI